MVIMSFIKFVLGYSIHATLKLFPPIAYQPITEIADFERFLENRKPSVADLDELWIQADSRRPHDLANLVISAFGAQSRKTHTDVYLTAQSWGRTDNRIREVVDYVWYPTIGERYDGDNERFIGADGGMPLTIEIDKYDGFGDYIGHTTLPTVIGGYVIPFMYDTDEIIRRFKNPEGNRFKELFRRYYEASQHKAKDLARYIRIMEKTTGKCEDVKIRTSIDVAEEIIYSRASGIKPKWYNEK